MTTVRVKDWGKFQHFKDRRPPWIKLYRDILDDLEWHKLDPAAAKTLVMLWLIASEFEGELPDTEELAFRLRKPEEDCKALILKLSHWLEHDDIDAISERQQSDRPERETEREEETEGDAPAKASKVGKAKPVHLSEWLLDLAGADAVPAGDPIFEWAEAQGIPADWLSLAWFAFDGRYGSSSEKKYTDWRAVFRRAVKEDWLRLWRHGRNGWELTTAGIQAEREMANAP